MSRGQQEKFLSYNGELLIFHLSKEKCSESGAGKVTRLHVRRMVFDTGTELFVQKSSGLFSMPGEGIEMICCDCTSDFRTGINLPYILMKKKKRNIIKYFLLLLHNANEFEQCLNFKLDYELKGHARLLPGPSVLWRHAEKLFYISLRAHTVLNAPAQFSSIEWAGVTKDEGIVVLGIRTAYLSGGGEEQKFPKSDEAIWGSEFFGYAIEKQKMLPGTCFLPHAYSSVVACLHVISAEVLKNQFRTSVIAVTQKRQLILFQDGVPKDVCQLPYKDPCSLQIVESGGNNLLCVVSFASGDVCALWKDNLQVASRWQKVKSVLVDDFVGTGTEQILLLLKDELSTDSLNTFRITDFGNVNYTRGINYKEDTCALEELQENHCLMIKALEARLQAGFASVQELRKHLLLKRKVLLESCRALIDLVQARHHELPSAEEEGLVSLWDDRENGFDRETPSTSEDTEHLIENVWQRVVDDDFVVGVKIKEPLRLSLSDISLSLVMDQKFASVSPIVCRNSIVKLNRTSLVMSLPSRHMEPLPKRIKLDCHNEKVGHEGSSKIDVEGAMSFTAVTQLSPLLAFHHLYCMVLLHAKRRKYQNGNLQESKKVTLLCGRISLSLEDISSEKYAINLLKDNHCADSLEDIFAIITVYCKFSFQIFSPECTLTPLNTWLREQMKCVPIKVCPENMFCHKSGSLHGTLFNWNLKTPFEGALTVFCRHQTILFHVLHSLIRVLSPTCKIKPLRLESKTLLAEQLALALEGEMDTLMSSFSSAVNEVENNLALRYEGSKKTSSAIVDSLLDKKEAVQQFREEFQNEQKQSTLGMNLILSSASYRQIALKVAEAQLDSDMIAWRLSKS
uniref:FA complementation group B n=1 Tax=Sphenodon punctatus TaxID=8508 RepID=A0A8D0GQ85_SPHPU